jgi:hypothetical protein
MEVLKWIVIIVIAVSIVLPCTTGLPQHGARRLCVCLRAALQGQAPVRLPTALQQRAFDLVQVPRR